MINTRREPLLGMQTEMGRLRGEMDRVFGRFGFPFTQNSDTARQYPAINLWEDSDNYYAEAELPGVSMEDLEIYVNGGTELTIRSERKEPDCDGGVWHRRERGYGKFMRALELPTPVNESAIEARLSQGILKLILPKQDEAKPRRIEVKVD